jgi:hypothetical protein
MIRISPAALSQPSVAQSTLSRYATFSAPGTIWYHPPPLDHQSLQHFEALQYARCLAEVAIGRTNPGGVVGPDHPFEVSAADMTRELATITGIEISLPPARQPRSTVSTERVQFD